MTSLTKTILSVFILGGLWAGQSQQAISQDRKGLTGIGVQFSTPPQYNSPLFIISSMAMSPDILISTWLTDRVALEPSIGILAYTDQTFWRLGLTFVNHFGQEKLTPFVLVRSKAYLTSNNGSTGSDYLIGVAVGGEYFIGEKFSVSGECQLNHWISDKDRSLFLKYNITTTGVGVAGRFYLN